jgi:hypothetical protein
MDKKTFIKELLSLTYPDFDLLNFGRNVDLIEWSKDNNSPFFDAKKIEELTDLISFYNEQNAEDFQVHKHYEDIMSFFDSLTETFDFQERLDNVLRNPLMDVNSGDENSADRAELVSVGLVFALNFGLLLGQLRGFNLAQLAIFKNHTVMTGKLTEGDFVKMASATIGGMKNKPVRDKAVNWLKSAMQENAELSKYRYAKMLSEESNQNPFLFGRAIPFDTAKDYVNVAIAEINENRTE